MKIFRRNFIPSLLIPFIPKYFNRLKYTQSEMELTGRIAQVYIMGFIFKLEKDGKDFSYLKHCQSFKEERIIIPIGNRYSKEYTEIVSNKSGVYGFINLGDHTIANSVDWENKYRFTCQDVLDEIERQLELEYVNEDGIYVAEYKKID